MPFAVFRRHQRTLMAIFAILAMFGFVVADSLPRLFQDSGRAAEDREIVRLGGRPVLRSELDDLRFSRLRANQFLNALFNQEINAFGGTTTRDLVDSMVLRRRAEEMGLAADPELARRWLSQLTDNKLDAARFDEIYKGLFRDQVTGEQLLVDIADQVRQMEVRKLAAQPPVTPLDVYQAYRDQNERVSVQAVAFPVAEFISQVPEPTAADVQAFYSRSKNRLPDPSTSTPGFTIPRRVRFESVSADPNVRAASLRPTLTEAELLAAYDRRKGDYVLDPLAKLPTDLFAGDPEAKLTPAVPGATPPAADPPRYRPYLEVRPLLEDTLAREKAEAEIDAKLAALKTTLQDYADARFDYFNPEEDAPRRPTPPTLPNLKSLADRDGLTYESSPPLDRAAAARFGTIARSRLVGAGGRNFVETLFDPKATVFDPIELADDLGRRYLAWTTAIDPPRVPQLAEIRDEVIAALKAEKARPIAERAAARLAEQARARGGDLKVVAGDRPVITTQPVPKLIPAPNFGGRFRYTTRPSEIPELPAAGEPLRAAVFALRPQEVVVQPNQPGSSVYVLTLNQRFPAEFDAFYSPFGPQLGLQQEVGVTTRERQQTAWMNTLRTQAGIPAGWSPPDEPANSSDSTGETPDGQL